MKAIGIILAGGGNAKMKDLTKKKAVAALPVAGGYRAIDFALSSMSNSHISTVAVVSQYNSGSLSEHLSSAKWWDFGRKQGGMYLFTPTITPDNSTWFRGTADAIYQNIDFLKKCHEPYVIMASGDAVYKLDFEEVLEYHIAKQADVTVVCKQLGEKEDVSRFGTVMTDETGRITEFEEKPVCAHSTLVSAGIYVIRRRQLIDLVTACVEDGRYDFVQDILLRYKNVKRMYAYRMEDYWSNIATIDSYYRTNMDFLKPEIRRYFFGEMPGVQTKVTDLPPAKYNPGTRVTGSLLAGGTVINGTVERSVLCPKVFVGTGCVIKDCVILDDVYIGDGAYLERCIVESESTIRPGNRYVGGAHAEVVAEQAVRYGMI